MTCPRIRPALAALACLSALVGRSPAPASAQEALVLSGGGARGLAHIGVLLQLQELGYDPDLVIGNSMGAVVGALYAAGYHPEDIRDRTVAVEWGGMFDPTAAVLGADRALRLPMLNFSLDPARDGFSRGLIGEWRINRTLVRLLFDANARALGDFDRLARRYRAVAADLETGEAVVLARGDLARAVRASMAYPGFFAPVRWGDRVLIDGGIADNLPTSQARRLGATHIIAVDVSRSPEEIASQEPLAVAQRALNLMQENLHPDPVPPDILILPIIEGSFGGPAFPDDPAAIVEVGLETARRDLPPPRTPDRPARRDIALAPQRFAALRIESSDSALAALAREAFAPVAPGPYDPGAVLSAVDRLYSTGLFEGVWPRVERADTPEGGPALVVRLDAPARLALSAGAGFDNDRGGRGWAALDRHTAIGRRPAVLTAAGSTDGLRRWLAFSARLHPFGRPTLPWSFGAHLQETSVRTFTEDARSTVEILRAGAWVGLELPHILRERVITVTGRAEWIDPEDAPGGASFGPLLRLAALPSEVEIVGTPLLLEGEARWGARTYWRAAVAGSRAMGRDVLRAAAIVDFRMVSDLAPLDVQPALGDGHAVPGLRWGEVRGNARAVLGLDLAVPAPVGGFARLRLRSGAAGDDPIGLERARWITGAQLGGVWRAPLGVIEAGYGIATLGDGRFDVSVGRQF